MVLDLLLRLLWIVSISPQTIGSSEYSHELFMTLVAAIEVYFFCFFVFVDVLKFFNFVSFCFGVCF